MHGICRILAHNIETLLTRNGISGLELDRRAGLSQGRVAAIRRGMVPGVDAVQAIARCMGVTVDWLLTDHAASGAMAAEKEEAYARGLRVEFYLPLDAKPGDTVTGRVVRM